MLSAMTPTETPKADPDVIERAPEGEDRAGTSLAAVARRAGRPKPGRKRAPWRLARVVVWGVWIVFLCACSVLSTYAFRLEVGPAPEVVPWFWVGLVAGLAATQTIGALFIRRGLMRALVERGAVHPERSGGGVLLVAVWSFAAWLLLMVPVFGAIAYRLSGVMWLMFPFAIVGLLALALLGPGWVDLLGLLAEREARLGAGGGAPSAAAGADGDVAAAGSAPVTTDEASGVAPPGDGRTKRSSDEG